MAIYSIVISLQEEATQVLKLRIEAIEDCFRLCLRYSEGLYMRYDEISYDLEGIHTGAPNL